MRCDGRRRLQSALRLRPGDVHDQFRRTVLALRHGVSIQREDTDRCEGVRGRVFGAMIFFIGTVGLATIAILLKEF
jgi:hypothetical protein